MKFILCTMTIFCLSTTMLADEVKVEIKDLPKGVLDTVNKRFPKGKLSEATKVTDDGEVEYELTIEVGETTHYATVTADGILTHVGKEIAIRDLPRAVAGAIAKAYPKASLTYAGEISEVIKGKEVVTFFEVELTTAGKKSLALEVTPDGKILKTTSVK